MTRQPPRRIGQRLAEAQQPAGERSVQLRVLGEQDDIDWFMRQLEQLGSVALEDRIGPWRNMRDPGWRVYVTARTLRSSTVPNGAGRRAVHPDTVTCVYCGRAGTRGFVVSSGNPDEDFAQTTWRCASTRACERRQRQNPIGGRTGTQR